MESIKYQIDSELPVIYEADVIVVGGGPGGIGAAVMASRNGAKTLLIERYGQLGGMASIGEVNPFMPNHHVDVCMDKPVYTDWLDQMESYLPPEIIGKIASEDDYESHRRRSINKDVAALAAEDICLSAGVKILYHHQLVDVVITNGVIDSVVLLSKSGFVAAKAKNYVDCSGDGDLAARAGCEFEMGDQDGNCQPMTLCFKLSNIDRPKFQEWGNYHALQKAYEEAKESGELSCPREKLLWFQCEDESVIHFNTTRVQGHNATDGVSLSEAELIARQQLREYFRWFRARVPGFEQCEIYSMGFHIGVRETRRIKGLNYITREDFVKRSKFPDAIARCNYPIDIHAAAVGGASTELVHMPREEFYEIPYGCVVAKDCDNLTVGGRPISVDVAIHGSARVMPPACSVGQAAGLAAAVASQRNTAPADLDGCEIRMMLKEQGAYL